VKLATDAALLKGVWKSFTGDEYVLKGVDIQVREGDFVGVYGRSGSGKSTLLRLMGVMDRPTKGTVTVLGRETGSLSEGEASAMRLTKIGYVFQTLNLIPHISVIENIEVPMWLAGAGEERRRERARALLERFGLSALGSRKPGEVSVGEQQRVAALRALANEPGLLIADEPTAHLDDESAAPLVEFISKLNEETGVTVVMTSTSREETEMAGRRLTLSGGRLTEE
jgi:ABC-type lipoprotein export system ATPase subunit